VIAAMHHKARAPSAKRAAASGSADTVIRAARLIAYIPPQMAADVNEASAANRVVRGRPVELLSLMAFVL